MFNLIAHMNTIGALTLLCRNQNKVEQHNGHKDRQHLQTKHIKHRQIHLGFMHIVCPKISSTQNRDGVLPYNGPIERL